MAVCTGLIVANLYYCQPLIVLIANEFKIPEASAGTITYLTQAGYAVGLFFMVPLGDKLERKRQILMTTFASVIALLIAATAKSFLILQIASLLIGITSIVPQLILPLAASLSAPEQRGKVVGSQLIKGYTADIGRNFTFQNFKRFYWRIFRLEIYVLYRGRNLSFNFFCNSEQISSKQTSVSGNLRTINSVPLDTYKNTARFARSYSNQCF